MLSASGELGKPYVVSAAVPKRIAVAILRAAFAATVRDPQFLAEAATQRLPVSPKSAEEATRIINEIYGAPDDIVAAARKIAGDCRPGPRYAAVHVERRNELDAFEMHAAAGAAFALLLRAADDRRDRAATAA